ncbi:hypothetical protein CYMTET_25648 [Cymbomonas tetramitiformis]|uniref:DUF3531 domain-containing protein n=1 Tax=Cymbomonas tetramitiformis TaxID=36881 RepID=A0AAE0FTB8_9CHLO|nr:hypothetical protein CYMTET_25648 [Cymbomonas tetramitiformis]
MSNGVRADGGAQYGPEPPPKPAVYGPEPPPKAAGPDIRPTAPPQSRRDRRPVQNRRRTASSQSEEKSPDGKSWFPKGQPVTGEPVSNAIPVDDLGTEKSSGTEIPDWQRLLEEEAANDPELAEILEGTNRDPKAVEAKIRERFEARSEEIFRERTGRDEGMVVTFREFDSSNLWVWIELYDFPSENEKTLVSETIDAWFTLGHLGAFNCFNLQVLEAGSEVSGMQYSMEKAQEDANFSLFHNMDEVQLNKKWMRFWCDLGTADELAIDILVNSLMNLSREYVGIKQLIFGGVNEDWSEGTEGHGRDGDLFFRLGSKDR